MVEAQGLPQGHDPIDPAPGDQRREALELTALEAEHGQCLIAAADMGRQLGQRRHERLQEGAATRMVAVEAVERGQREHGQRVAEALNALERPVDRGAGDPRQLPGDRPERQLITPLGDRGLQTRVEVVGRATSVLSGAAPDDQPRGGAALLVIPIGVVVELGRELVACGLGRLEPGIRIQRGQREAIDEGDVARARRSGHRPQAGDRLIAAPEHAHVAGGRAQLSGLELVSPAEDRRAGAHVGVIDQGGFQRGADALGGEAGAGGDADEIAVAGQYRERERVHGHDLDIGRRHVEGKAAGRPEAERAGLGGQPAHRRRP
jgi:hypothetical protein